MTQKYSKLKGKHFVLDECISMKNNTLKKRLGFVNAKEIVKEGTSDDELLKKAEKRNLTIITKDMRFALNTILQGKEIIFQNHMGIRIFVPKNKITIVEHNCNSRKYDDEITYYLHEHEKIIIP